MFTFTGICTVVARIVPAHAGMNGWEPGYDPAPPGARAELRRAETLSKRPSLGTTLAVPVPAPAWWQLCAGFVGFLSRDTPAGRRVAAQAPGQCDALPRTGRSEGLSMVLGPGHAIADPGFGEDVDWVARVVA